MNEKLGEVIKQDLYSILLNNWQIYCVACLSSVTRKESDTKFFCNVIKFWYVLMHWHAWTMNKSGNLDNWGRRIIMLWLKSYFMRFDAQGVICAGDGRRFPIDPHQVMGLRNYMCNPSNERHDELWILDF